jgi:hypothetical protein
LLLSLLTLRALAASLTTDGACPGPVDVRAAGLTPNALVEIWVASEPGWELLPTGVCAGAPSALGTGALRAGTVRADAGGGLVQRVTLGRSACDRLVQLVDTSTCELSTTARVMHAPRWSTRLLLDHGPVSLLPAVDGGLDVLGGGDPLVAVAPFAWWVHLSADGDPVWALQHPTWDAWGAAVALSSGDRVAIARSGVDLVASRMSAEGEERWTLVHSAAGVVVDDDISAIAVGSGVAVAAGSAWFLDEDGGVSWVQRFGGPDTRTAAVAALASGELIWSVVEPGLEYHDAGVRLTWTDAAGAVLRTVGFHYETSLGEIRGIAETAQGEILAVGTVGHDACVVVRLSATGSMLDEAAYGVAGRSFTCTGITALPSGGHLVSGRVGAGDEAQLVLDPAGVAVRAFTVDGSLGGAAASRSSGGVWLTTWDAVYGRPVVTLVDHPERGCARSVPFQRSNTSLSFRGAGTPSEVLLATSAPVTTVAAGLLPGAEAICP